jgi:hypothetical protein
MPRKIKPRTGWRAGGLVPDVKLSRAQFQTLCDAAGLDPVDADDRTRVTQMAEGVTQAIAIFRGERDNLKAAPLPIHEQKALEQVQDKIDTLIESFNALDDASLSRLTRPRKRQSIAWGKSPDPPAIAARRQRLNALLDYRAGIDPYLMLAQLREWSDTVTLALRDVDGRENRGRRANTPRRVLLSLLADVFAAVTRADEAALSEFLRAGCAIAGDPISAREAQSQAAELDRVNVP